MISVNEIRWGIIGCGDVTEVKSGPAFQKAPHSRLVAVMRRSSELAEDYARRHNVPRWYNTAEDLIRDPEVNAVYVATPPAFHKEYTLAAASAGKAVYVEKPMALTFADCQEMVDCCHRHKVPLFVAYYRRSLPRFLKVKELLDSKAIGDVRFVQITHYQRSSADDRNRELQSWRVDPAIAGGGYFYDLAAHTLDLLDYFLGPIASAHGQAANQAALYAAEDIVTGHFAFASGVQGTGIWCFSAFEDVEQVSLVGTKGKITFSCFHQAPVVLTTSDARQEFVIDHPQHVQQPLISAIVEDLLGRGKSPSTGDNGARVNRVMEILCRC